MKEKKEQGRSKAEVSAELVAKAREGDQAAFSELYKQTNLSLYRSVRSMVHDEDLAWDILQDSYLRAYQSLDKLDSNEAFLSWLRRIAVNETARQMSKRLPVSFSELGSEEDEGLPELPDSNPENQPELALDRKETSRLVRKILSELPEQQQLVVGMRYYEDMSITEIAELLDLAPGTVKAQLFKGRKKVEAKVRDLEKQGVKLYGMSPIPFLMALLRKLEPSRQTEKKAIGAVLSQLSATGGTQITAMTAGQVFFQRIAGKLAASLLVLALLGGSLWVSSKLLRDMEPDIGPVQPTESRFVSPSEDPERSTEQQDEKETKAPKRTEPSDPSDPSESSDLADPSDPSKPPEPSDSSAPTDPSAPADPNKPADPSDPTDPTKPSEVAGSSESSDSTEPSESSEPPESTDPSESSQAPDPSESSQPPEPPEPDPTNPSNPANPPVPTRETDPTDPTDPTEPPVPPTKPPTEPPTDPPTEPPTDPPVELITGVCGAQGNNLTWSLNPDTGELTIEGRGSMKDYSSASAVPWYSYRSSIKSVTITAGADTVGSRAFSGCTALSSVTLPEELTSIGSYAFSECSSLSAVRLRKGLTTINSYAFSKCSSLSSVTLPEGLTDIRYSAFSDCSSLSAITLPEGLISIGNSAFARTNLASIRFPASLTNADNYAFTSCPELASITVASGNPTYSSDHGVLYTKDMKTLLLCPNAYDGVLTVPEGVTKITRITGCTKLTAVNFPESLEEIVSFYSCKLITSLTIPKNLKKFGSNCLTGMPSMESFTVASGNSTFSSLDGVLYNKAKTELIRFPEARGGSFSVPERVTALGSNAFSGCSRLTSVTLPSTLQTLRNSAFYNCTGLTSISLPSSLRTIGDAVFYGCIGFTSVTIPDNVTTMGGTVFANCTNLTYVHLPSKLSTLGSSVFVGTRITSIAIPDGVGELAGELFYNCATLTSVTLPSSLYNIGTLAFHGTGLVSVTVPDGTRIIGPSAFSACTSLTSITIPASVTTISTNAFDNSPHVTIYGYAGSYAQRYANNCNIPFVVISP